MSFTTLRLVYNEALANFRQGQSNSVLVITTGRTPTNPGWPGLQEFIRESFDPARPVAVNVIDLGIESDRATWEAVAQASGGSYQNVATSASPELTSAITIPGLARHIQQAQRPRAERFGIFDLRVVADTWKLHDIRRGSQFPQSVEHVGGRHRVVESPQEP